MTCSDVEGVLPELLDGAPDGAFAADFETHVRSCPACADLVSDLKLIASEARQLAGTEEPAPRVWVRIAAELRAEGLIHDQDLEPESTPARPILVPASSRRRRWSAWWLAPVAAALLAAGSYVVSHRPAPQVAKQQAAPVPATSPAVDTSAASSPSAPLQSSAEPAKKSGKPRDPAWGTTVASAVEPGPSAEDQQFLSAVSTLAPSMRVTYENELQAVNADIRETQAYVNRNPGDEDARQHLMDAYQQKALLYQIALDRIQ